MGPQKALGLPALLSNPQISGIIFLLKMKGARQMLKPPVRKENISKVIGVMSGKGGVGKSSITALAAVALARKGFKVGILDADITGPSMPRMFGLKGRLATDDDRIIPAVTRKLGIEVVSLNLLMDEEGDPVIWRGPILAGVVMQFWNDVNWGKLDYLLIDMPPGTGDIPLSLMQSVPLDGLVMVTTPQGLAKLIVGKSVRMAETMNVPMLGTVQNMSYIKCPCCDTVIRPFGDGGDASALPQPLVRLPIDPRLTELADSGDIELAEAAELPAIAEIMESA